MRIPAYPSKTDALFPTQENEMDHSDLAIEVATRDDLPGILDLQERNLSEHGGNLSVRWSAEWFEKAI
jgi:hypothetical protein